MIAIALLLFSFTNAFACKISEYESGTCSYRYLPKSYKNSTVKERQARKLALAQWKNGTEGGPCEDGEGEHCMSFCGKYIANYYPPCVPNVESIDADRNFPDGRWKSFNVKTKDRWIEQETIRIIEERIAIETNKTARKLGIDEFGNKGKTKRRFHKNRACQEAYRKYMCWINFPRCDDDEESLPMCQSVCLNFFRTCGYEEDLWMCDGDNLIDNQVSSEPNERDPSYDFVGAPFKKNEYGRRKKPIEVCTPSIKGSASIFQTSKLVMSLGFALSVILIIP